MKISVFYKIKHFCSSLLYSMSETIRWTIFKLLFQQKHSNLLKHAIREMKLVKLDSKDSDYNGMLYYAVLDLMRIFSAQGHSGFSASCVRMLFNKLSNYENLSALTTNKSEWMEIEEKLYQNKRNPSCFSTDLKTYYSVDDKKRTKQKLIKK